MTDDDGNGDSKEQKRYQAFMDAFGHALIEWQFVEEGLYALFVQISGIGPDLASAIYYSINSTNGHVKLVSEVAKVQIKDPALVELWSKLAKGLRAQAESRNMIAHGVASAELLEDGGLEPSICRPAGYKVLHSADPWTTSRINAATEEFVQLHLAMHKFSQLLRKKSS